MTNRTHIHTLPGRQQGAVLAISLIILLLMTLIGVTAMQGTTLEEKMAGNSRDRNHAFQSAEAALLQAETWLNGFANTTDFGVGTNNGLYSSANKDLNLYKTSSTWSGTASNSASAVPGTNTAPRHYIEHIGCTVGTPGSLNVGGYGAAASTGDVQSFRITVRGTGGTDNAIVFLRSHFGKEFGSCT